MSGALDDYQDFLARTQRVIDDLTASEERLIVRLRAVREALALLRALRHRAR